MSIGNSSVPLATSDQLTGVFQWGYKYCPNGPKAYVGCSARFWTNLFSIFWILSRHNVKFSGYQLQSGETTRNFGKWIKHIEIYTSHPDLLYCAANLHVYVDIQMSRMLTISSTLRMNYSKSTFFRLSRYLLTPWKTDFLTESLLIIESLTRINFVK